MGSVLSWLFGRLVRLLDEINEDELRHIHPGTYQVIIKEGVEPKAITGHSLWCLRKWAGRVGKEKLNDDQKAHVRSFVRTRYLARLCLPFAGAFFAMSTVVVAQLALDSPDNARFKLNSNDAEVWFGQPRYTAYDFTTGNALGQKGIGIVFEIERESLETTRISVKGTVQRNIDDLFEKFEFKAGTVRLGGFENRPSLLRSFETFELGQFEPVPDDQLLSEVVIEDSCFYLSLDPVEADYGYRFVVCIPLMPKDGVDLKTELQRLRKAGSIFFAVE